MAHWANTNGGNIPENAVRAGYEADGRPLYIARARIDGIMTPGKAGSHLSGACIPYGGQERVVEHYEILVMPSGSHGFYKWLPDCTDGFVPPNSVETDPGVFVGRFEHCGSLVPGKIHRDHRCAYIPYGGQEVSSTCYESFVRIK